MTPIDWHARSAALRFDGRAVIGGRRVAAVSGETFACISPLDGRTLTQIQTLFPFERGTRGVFLGG